LVSGSELYKIEIRIKSLSPTFWKGVQQECAGKIDSLIELLQGRLSTSAMAIVTRRENGLFPKPAEISMNCSCPDWAGLCKHLAASLYGVGARLDEKPELLFLLRGVDAGELISHASAAEAIRQRPGTSGDARAAISEQDLSEVFGIDLDSANPSTASATQRPRPLAEKRLGPKAKHKTGKRRSRAKEKLPEILVSRVKPRNSKRNNGSAAALS
jgi:uncharacterized Zn finger protein